MEGAPVTFAQPPAKTPPRVSLSADEWEATVRASHKPVSETLARLDLRVLKQLGHGNWPSGRPAASRWGWGEWMALYFVMHEAPKLLQPHLRPSQG